MKTFANTFLKGLIFTLPIVATFGLLYWLFVSAETLLKVPLSFILPAGWYVPGMGVVAAIGLIFVFGILVQAYIIKHVFICFDAILERIPLVNSIYGSARDLLEFIAGDKGEHMQKVVTYQINDEARLVGFVTSEGVSVGESNDLIAVYFPMSYQIGGYLLYLPREKCEVLDIPVKDAMQQVLTAHIGVSRKAKKEAKAKARKESKENNNQDSKE